MRFRTSPRAIDARRVTACRLLLDARDLALTSGASVATWRDKSGTLADTTGDASANPTFDVSTNSRPTVRFTRTHAAGTPGQHMTIPIVSSTASDWTVIAAIDMLETSGTSSGDAITDGRYLLDDQTGRLVITPISGSNKTHVGWYDGTWREIAANVTGLQILSWVLGGDGNGRVYRNGVLLGSAAYTQQALSTTPKLGGSYDNGGAFTDARLGFLALWQRALSDTERSPIERSLGAYYGVRVS